MEVYCGLGESQASPPPHPGDVKRHSSSTHFGSEHDRGVCSDESNEEENSAAAAAAAAARTAQDSGVLGGPGSMRGLEWTDLTQEVMSDQTAAGGDRKSAECLDYWQIGC